MGQEALLPVGLEINIEIKFLKLLKKIDRIIQFWSLYFVFFNFTFIILNKDICLWQIRSLFFF